MAKFINKGWRKNHPVVAFKGIRKKTFMIYLYWRICFGSIYIWDMILYSKYVVPNHDFFTLSNSMMGYFSWSRNSASLPQIINSTLSSDSSISFTWRHFKFCPVNVFLWYSTSAISEETAKTVQVKLSAFFENKTC